MKQIWKMEINVVSVRPTKDQETGDVEENEEGEEEKNHRKMSKLGSNWYESKRETTTATNSVTVFFVRSKHITITYYNIVVSERCRATSCFCRLSDTPIRCKRKTSQIKISHKIGILSNHMHRNLNCWCFSTIFSIPIDNKFRKKKEEEKNPKMKQPPILMEADLFIHSPCTRPTHTHTHIDNKYIYPNIQFVQMLISPKCPSTVRTKCLSFEPRYPTNCLSPFAFSDQWKTNDNKKTTCAFVSRGSIFGQSFQTQFHLKNIQTYSWAKWDNKLDHWIVEGKSPRGNCFSFSPIEIVNFIWPIDFCSKYPAASS